MSDITLTKYTIQEYEARGGFASKHFRPSTMYFLAENGSNLVGKIAFVDEFYINNPPHYYIYQINAFPETQGIGSTLVKAVEDEAMQNDIWYMLARFNRPNLWKNLGYTIDHKGKFASKNLRLLV